MKKTILSIAVLALCACTSTPYQRQELDKSNVWADTRAVDLDAQWWTQFDDARLLAILNEVRRSNPDIRMAAINVHKAQLAAGLADTQLTPTVSASLGSSTARLINSGGSWQKNNTSTLNVAYEVDLWGKLAANQRSAQQQWLATQADGQAVRLVQESTAAGIYWEIAALKAQRNLLTQTQQYNVQVLKLAQSRFQAGAAAQTDVLLATQTMLQQERSLVDVDRQLKAQHNALALLLDQSPAAADVVSRNIAALKPSAAVPSVAPGLPADLLARRPDLIAAEARLKSNLADVDAIEASFYPGLSLTGSLGTSSVVLSELLKNPLATLGGSLTLPFLSYNTLNLQLKTSQAQFESAQINFRKAFYTALAEVDNGLKTRQQLIVQSQSLTRELAVNRKNETLAQRRYEAGSTDIQLWLTATETRQQIEFQLLQNRYAQLKNALDIYKAVGGAPLPAAQS